MALRYTPLRMKQASLALREDAAPMLNWDLENILFCQSPRSTETSQALASSVLTACLGVHHRRPAKGGVKGQQKANRVISSAPQLD